jgi:hypothetical protein
MLFRIIIIYSVILSPQINSVGKRNFSVIKEVEYLVNTVLQMFNTVIYNTKNIIFSADDNWRLLCESAALKYYNS